MTSFIKEPGSVEFKGMWVCDNCFVRVSTNMYHSDSLGKVRYLCDDCSECYNVNELRKNDSNLVHARLTPPSNLDYHLEH